MRVPLRRTWTRVLGPATVAAALLVGGCSVGVPGRPVAGDGAVLPPVAPTSAAPVAPPPPPPTSADRPEPSGRGCRIALSGSGSISMSGVGGRAVTRNGATSFSCGDGPMVAIASIAASGVTFSVDGAEVAVAPGASAAVGSYRITVSEVDDGGAEFEVVPGG